MPDQGALRGHACRREFEVQDLGFGEIMDLAFGGKSLEYFRLFPLRLVTYSQYVRVQGSVHLPH